MVDELLPYYNRELLYIRRLAAEFADAHPKIAGRLRLSQDAIEDPHVDRLIQAFAFLTARIRRKIDDDFPELTDALLNVLYPHYLAPIPSMAVVQLTCPPDLASGQSVPVGIEIDTEPVGGETCRFRTCYPVTLWPIGVEAATLRGRPIAAPPNPRATGAVAALRLTLRCLTEGMTFSQLAPDRLRFFLRGQPPQVYPLYELIFNNTISVALADSAVDTSPVILGPDCIQPVGYETGETMLPYPARSFVGYSLLTEYFAFPEKFLFFDVCGLSAKLLLAAKSKLEIFLYLNKTFTDLERSVSAESFALGCTPVVNLFQQRAEPIQLSQSITEYRVVPDARRPGATEVYSVDSVVGTAPDGTETTYAPFYSLKHGATLRAQRTFWHPVRRPASERDPASEVFLSLVDLDFNPHVPADTVVSLRTTCLNRDLPNRLPYGGGHPFMQLVEPMAAVEGITCVTPLTRVLRVPRGRRAYWCLLSHLNLNHLSIVRDDESGEAMREILRLYDFRDLPETLALIDGLLDVRSRRGTARAPSKEMGTFCRGVDVEMEFEESRFSITGSYVLACVLERFIALYASINSFTRLTVRLQGRSGVLRKWSPRAGDRQLL